LLTLLQGFCVYKRSIDITRSVLSECYQQEECFHIQASWGEARTCRIIFDSE